MSSNDLTVLARVQGRVGVIELNRPRALNALTLDMVRLVAAALDEWRDDSAVHAVVLTAAGDKAFCAGGDIREIRRLALDHDFDGIERFFVEEYALNRAIARYPKPFISLISGICMGGGIGLSVHGSIRVATEAAVFAMPETTIGFFPDVGATFILPRLRGCWGMYLGLSGARVTGSDAVQVGLATHHVPQAQLASLLDALAEDGPCALAAFTVPPSPVRAPPPAPFAHPDLHAVIAALDADPSPWARDTRHSLSHASPSALAWSFEILRRGATQTLEQCQAAELALTRHAVRHPDFAEGVRAMVVDKDRAPKWSPARIEDVDTQAIGRMFN